MDKDKLTDEERQWLSYNPNTSDIVEFIEAREKKAVEAYRAELLAGSGEPVAMRQKATGIFRTDTEAYSLAGYEEVYTAEQLAAARLQATEQANERANKSWALMCEKMIAAARLQDQQRIAELEANLKRATVALKAQQLETTCECKNCMNATEAIIEALKVDYDQHTDVLTVDGVRYSGHIFRTLALCAPGTWLRFEDRRDGVVSVFTPGPEMERAFDAMTGKCAIYGA
jgi:hypothetical protein